MCEADLILVEGHWVLSGSPCQLKKSPAQYFVLCNLGEQDHPVLISPDICVRLCGEKFNRALRRPCIKSGFGKCTDFFFALFIKQLLGTHIRHPTSEYILYRKHILIRTLYLCLWLMYVSFSLRAAICSWCVILTDTNQIYMPYFILLYSITNLANKIS